MTLENEFSKLENLISKFIVIESIKIGVATPTHAEWWQAIVAGGENRLLYIQKHNLLFHSGGKRQN